MHTDRTLHVKGKKGLIRAQNRDKFSFETDGQTDGQTETQVHVLSCAFAAKNQF